MTLTISFTLPDCSFARNGATFEITGSIHITDLSSTDFGIRVVFDNLDHKFTGDGGRDLRSKLNGARQVLPLVVAFDLHDSTTVDLKRSSDRRCGTAWRKRGSSRSRGCGTHVSTLAAPAQRQSHWSTATSDRARLHRRSRRGAPRREP